MLSDSGIDTYLVIGPLKYLSQCFQIIHCHPGTLGTTTTAGAFTGRGRDNKLFIGCLLLQLIKYTLVGGYNEAPVVHFTCSPNNLSG